MKADAVGTTGNAAVGGMTADLNFPSNGLSVATSIFYASEFGLDEASIHLILTSPYFDSLCDPRGSLYDAPPNAQAESFDSRCGLDLGRRRPRHGFLYQLRYYPGHPSLTRRSRSRSHPLLDALLDDLLPAERACTQDVLPVHLGRAQWMRWWTHRSRFPENGRTRWDRRLAMDLYHRRCYHHRNRYHLRLCNRRPMARRDLLVGQAAVLDEGPRCQGCHVQQG